MGDVWKIQAPEVRLFDFFERKKKTGNSGHKIGTETEFEKIWKT